MSTQRRTKYHVRKRIFLNRDLDMRAIAIGIVEDTREIPNEDENDWKWGTIELTLGDCTRHVSYDFDLSTAKRRSDSLYKIRRIAEIVNTVREAIETEAKSIAARKIPKQNPQPKAKGAAG